MVFDLTVLYIQALFVARTMTAMAIAANSKSKEETIAVIHANGTTNAAITTMIVSV